MQQVNPRLAVGSLCALDSPLFEQAAQKASHKSGIVDDQSTHGCLPIQMR